MLEVSEVRRRVRLTIDRARQDAAERRARAEVAEERGRRFIDQTATPVARQLASALRAEGFHYRLSTPPGSVRLVSEKHHEDFIDLAVDVTQDPATIMTLISHIRGRRVSATERPLSPELEIDKLTEDHVLEFLLSALPVFVER